jgi:hypothetical protein
VAESGKVLDPVCFLTVVSRSFVIDSQCTDHIVGNKLGINSGNFEREIKLINVLMAPSLSRDLLLVSQHFKASLRVKFGSKEVNFIANGVMWHWRIDKGAYLCSKVKY